MTGKQKNAVAAVSGMMVITLLGKVLGLYRDILFANHYGLGMEANAFTTASLIPRTFFDAVFASAISASFIPIFNEYMGRYGEKKAFSFSDTFITLVGAFTLLLSVVGMIFAEPFARLFAAGYDAQTLQLCVSLLRMLFPTVLFTGLAYCFVGILQSMEEFTIPAAMSIVSNGAIILYYWTLDRTWGVTGLAVAFLVGWFLQVAIQVPPLRKKGYRYRPSFAFRDAGLKKVLILMLPVMVSTWIQPINLAVGVRYASYLFEGSGTTALNNANNLYSIILGVFVLSVANVIFPRLSRLVTGEQKEDFARLVRQTLMALCFLLIPMMIGLWVESEDLVRLLFERNRFTAEDTWITARALRYLCLGTMGYGVYIFLSRVFYARQRAKAPMLAGILSMATNWVLCLLLVKRYDVAGIAGASAIASLVSAACLVVVLHKEERECFGKEMLMPLIKIIVASAIMGVAAMLCRDLLRQCLQDSFVTRILVVGVPAAAGALVYVILTAVLKVAQTRMALEWISAKIGRKKGTEDV